MFDSGSRGTTFGVFVRFRKSRLPLRRGIVRLEEALALATKLRRERLHGRDDVFVIRETDGVVMDGGGVVAHLDPELAGDTPPTRNDATPEARDDAAPEARDETIPPDIPREATDASAADRARDGSETAGAEDANDDAVGEHEPTRKSGLGEHDHGGGSPNGHVRSNGGDTRMRWSQLESGHVRWESHERRAQGGHDENGHARVNGHHPGVNGAKQHEHRAVESVVIDDDHVSPFNGPPTIDNGSPPNGVGRRLGPQLPLPMQPVTLAVLLTSLARARRAAERNAAARRRFERSAEEIALALRHDSAPPPALVQRQGRMATTRALAARAAAAFADATALLASWIDAACNTASMPVRAARISAKTDGRVSSARQPR